MIIPVTLRAQIRTDSTIVTLGSGVLLQSSPMLLLFSFCVLNYGMLCVCVCVYVIVYVDRKCINPEQRIY